MTDTSLRAADAAASPAESDAFGLQEVIDALRSTYDAMSYYSATQRTFGFNDESHATAMTRNFLACLADDLGRTGSWPHRNGYAPWGLAAGEVSKVWKAVDEYYRKHPNYRGEGIHQRDMFIIERALIAAVECGVMVPSAEAIRSSLSADTPEGRTNESPRGSSR